MRLSMLTYSVDSELNYFNSLYHHLLFYTIHNRNDIYVTRLV